MRSIDRRQALIQPAAALSMAAVGVAGRGRRALADDGGWLPREKATPRAGDPYASRAYVYTVVTPDMDASIHFYRDVMGHELIDRGKLSGVMPTMAGVGDAGRPYALLRHHEFVTHDRGVIRLLEAPTGAQANRPRPLARIVDPGLAIMECHPNDWKEAFEHISHFGIRTITAPLYYYYGPADKPKNFSITFSAFGPAGEQMFISSHPNQEVMWPTTYKGLYGPFVSCTSMCWDRWGPTDFYDAIFGLAMSGDGYVGQETENFKSVNLLTGAPPDAYFQFGEMQDLTMELWEFRQWEPTPTPPWPTNLDHTGLAMVTILVDNLGAVRARAVAAKVAILGEGGLPTPEGKSRDAFYIRGVLGELIEVIGRG
jgi:catechol 2,3-dioxygenase-like lactoylglutathione lyase family enzyme